MIEITKSFNKINLINKYWQINIVEENRHKIAFNIRRSKYKFCVMSFELINASVTFQVIINNLLRSYFDKFVIIYLNNILIYFKNDEKHTQHIKLMIKVFRKHEFYAKSSKCNFY